MNDITKKELQEIQEQLESIMQYGLADKLQNIIDDNSIPVDKPVKHEIADLTDGQKIDAILLWQNSEEVHPLTCGCSATNNDEKKFEIVGKRLNGKLFIECSRCGVIQDWIPDSVYNYYIQKQFSV